jgi:hypothetical protein
MTAMIRCPVCKAENTGPSCRRCRADLSLLIKLEECREGYIAAATRCVARGEGFEAARLASRAHQLRRQDDSRRLLTLGLLLRRDFAGAWHAYSSEDQVANRQGKHPE